MEKSQAANLPQAREQRLLGTEVKTKTQSFPPIFSAKVIKLINIIKKTRNFILQKCYNKQNGMLHQALHLFHNPYHNILRG